MMVGKERIKNEIKELILNNNEIRIYEEIVWLIYPYLDLDKYETIERIGLENNIDKELNEIFKEPALISLDTKTKVKEFLKSVKFTHSIFVADKRFDNLSFYNSTATILFWNNNIKNSFVGIDNIIEFVNKEENILTILDNKYIKFIFNTLKDLGIKENKISRIDIYFSHNSSVLFDIYSTIDEYPRIVFVIANIYVY